MEIQWKDGSGVLHSWSSWDDPLCGWFEAEKLLPSSTTDISVHFMVHTIVKNFPVCQVDRRQSCTWVRSTGPGKDASEVVQFRTSFGAETAGVDAMFELAGPAMHCYVFRAWNAGRDDEAPDAWEHWEDVASRPCKEAQPVVLRAADEVAAPAAGAGDPVLYCANTTLRLVAAARTLQEIRKETLSGLQELDRSLYSQWVAVNSANTMSAGLGVAASVSLFIAPPVSIVLGLASAVVGGGTSTADALVDLSKHCGLRRQLSTDSWNEFAVGELEREWLWSRQSMAHSRRITLLDQQQPGGGSVSELATYGAQFGAAVAMVLTEVVEDASGAASVARAASAANAATIAAPAAAKVLGVAGAAVSVGVAIHGWTTTKSIQATVTRKIEELRSSVLRTQRWLAALGQLECVICRCCISLSNEASSCQGSCHYFHTRCLQTRSSQGNASGQDVMCPLCNDPISQEGVLEDLLAAGSLAAEKCL